MDIKKLVLIILCFMPFQVLSNQQAPAPGSTWSNALKQGAVGLAVGAIATAGTMFWLRARAESLFLRHTVVGLVRISAVAQLDQLLDDIEYFAESSNFYGILLLIDGDGGNYGTAVALHNELLLLNKKKPIIAFIENKCTGAAYVVASACDMVIAASCAKIGGIGVVSPHRYLAQPQYYTLDDAGVVQGNWQSDELYAGAYRMADSTSLRPYNEHERKNQQALVDDIYQTICGDVALARGLSLDAKDQWADGKLFSSKQAQGIGLVDMLGSFAQTKSAMLHTLKERGVKTPGRVVFLERQSWAQSWYASLFQKGLAILGQPNVKSRTL